MRKTFAPLDDALIERVFQPVSDAISTRIGLSRTAASCFCADSASLAWIVSRTTDLSDAVSRWDAPNAFFGFAMLLLGLIALTSLRILFRRASGKQANPLRPTMQPHRAVVLLLLLSRLVQMHASVPDIADAVMLLAIASALYLGACAERPPLRRGWAALAPIG